MKRISKKAVAVGLALGLTLGVAGAAFAYWTSSGTGNGTATTGKAASTLQITDTTSINDMAPGVAPEGISGTIENTQGTNGQNEYVTSVIVSIGSVTENTPGSGFSGTCSASDYTLSNATMTVGQDLTPGETVTFSGATIGFNDKAGTNQDNCQGATVNLVYTSN